MTLHQFKQRFEHSIDEEWMKNENKSKYGSRYSLAYAMWQENERQIDEYNA